MNKIIINNQKEFDSLPINVEGEIRITGNLEVINRTFEKAFIIVSGSAVIESVSDSAVIESVSGSAVIKSVYGYSSILLVSEKAKVNTIGQNIVRYFETEKDIELKLSKETIEIVLKKLDWFQINGVEKTEKLTMYKRVSKDFKTQENS